MFTTYSEKLSKNFLKILSQPMFHHSCHVFGNSWYTVELQWLEHLSDHENMFETGSFELMSVNHSTRSEGINGSYFRFSLT